MKRIVHLDLKGAPPNIQYLEKLFKVIKSWGATGILLEWEDTFPYSSSLKDIGSQNGSGDGLYSLEEVKFILDCAKQNDLEPIQLIQTIGHMEFVLKHPAYLHLREVPKFPAVLCPSIPESQLLVRDMLEQALEVQPDAAYLHIGADEVWHTAACPECQRRAIDSQHNRPSLFLNHIRDLAIFLKQKRPELTVLMWDDMLRSIKLETLMAYQLGELIQPVLWHYNPADCFQMDTNLWNKYKSSFRKLWVGSAFKGANGSCQLLSPVGRYVSNHEAWMAVFKSSQDIDYDGIILTGWSRYDHYAALCELLPVALPSLASCLRLLVKSDDTPKESVVSEVLPSEEWPGEQMARCVHSLVILRERCFNFLHGDLIGTWLNPWQIEHNYTNPAQVEGIKAALQPLFTEMSLLQNEIVIQLNAVIGKRSADEWIGTFVTPVVKKITEIMLIAEERSQTAAGIRP